MKKQRKPVCWLDLRSESVAPDEEAVIESNQVEQSDAFDYRGVNLIYDYETDMVFTLIGEPWPPTTTVIETVDQYKPGEL